MNLQAVNLPDFVLETGRLLIRPIKADDAAAVFRYRSDANTNRFQGWVPAILEEVHYFIENRVEKRFNQPDTWFQLVIILKSNGQLIGDIGIHFTGIRNDEVELGCTLALAHHGSGFAREALQEVIGFLFTEFVKNQLVAFIHPENQASVKLFGHLGFTCKSPEEDETTDPELKFGLLARDFLFRNRKDESTK